MELNKKIEILAMSAKYDASCASSGSNRKSSNGLGKAVSFGICHSWSEDGRCVSLLKILLTNKCKYDCAYCVNRVSNDVPRAGLSPEEISKLTYQFYIRNYIEGLFLSSGVYRSPDYTMELIYKTVLLLRKKYKFNGYIHVKAIPGTNSILINKIGLMVDRMSANIELPSDESLSHLAPDKKKSDIFGSMGSIKNNILTYNDSRPYFRSTPDFLPAGQSTQLIVGATPETDRKILMLSEALYRKISLKRVYYSAYVPVNNYDNRLPMVAPPLKRENRLYQADWLLRFYGFTASELLTEKNPDFDPDLDPKSCWALSNMHLFPMEINRVDYEMLLRVPGIGIKSAQKILSLRRVKKVTFEDLKKIGVVLKRARFFITSDGKYLEKNDHAIPYIKASISSNKLGAKEMKFLKSGQLNLFQQNLLPYSQTSIGSITGEL